MPFFEGGRESQLLIKGLLTKRADGNPIVSEDLLTNFCTGFGVDQEVPLRAAAYALPVLQMGEKFLHAQTEFYVAATFATKLNGVSPEIVRRNSDLIRTYVGLLKNQLNLTQSPVWLEEDNPYAEKRSPLILQLVKILREKGSERIIRFADSRNGDNSLAYIASHALYMWDNLDIDQDLFITKRARVPESLMVIGGPAEKLFFEARQLLLGNYPQLANRQTSQGFTEIGRRPPYYAIDGEKIIDCRSSGDQTTITFEDVKSIKDPDVLRDTFYLIISLCESLLFDDIPRIKKGQVKPQELDDLEAACGKLQEIIRQLES